MNTALDTAIAELPETVVEDDLSRLDDLALALVGGGQGDPELG